MVSLGFDSHFVLTHSSLRLLGRATKRASCAPASLALVEPERFSTPIGGHKKTPLQRSEVFVWRPLGTCFPSFTLSQTIS